MITWSGEIYGITADDTYADADNADIRLMKTIMIMMIADNDLIN